MVSFMLMVILGVYSVTRRRPFKSHLVAQTVALSFLGTLSPIEALTMKKGNSITTSSVVCGSMLAIAYLLLNCMTLPAGRYNTEEEAVEEHGQVVVPGGPDIDVDDQDSLENESVEKIASILEEPDDPEDVGEDQDVDVTQKTQLVMEDTGNETLIMTTWQRCVVNVIIITSDTSTFTFIQIPNRENGRPRVLEHHPCTWQLYLH